MNYFDILLAIPLLWALFKGFKKGLIIEVASLAALILGVYGGLNFSNYASEYLSKSFDISTDVLPLLSFALTFLLIVVVVYFFAKLLEKLIKFVALGLVNRLMGALFGLIKVTLIISVFVYIVESADLRYKFISEDFKKTSMLYEPLSEIPPFLLPLFSEWQNLEIDGSLIPELP